MRESSEQPGALVNTRDTARLAPGNSGLRQWTERFGLAANRIETLTSSEKYHGPISELRELAARPAQPLPRDHLSDRRRAEARSDAVLPRLGAGGVDFNRRLLLLRYSGRRGLREFPAGRVRLLPDFRRRGISAHRRPVRFSRTRRDRNPAG